MNKPEDGQVRQASRIVTAARRQAVAKERARITGKKVRQPSALEQAAVAWEQEQEAKAKKVEEERPMFSRQVETCPLSFQRVSLQPDSSEAGDGVDWKPCNPPPEKDKDKRAATTVTKNRVNMAGVCALSRRLMAIERARALGRKLVDLESWTLEQAGRRWAEERAKQSSPATKGSQR